MKPSLLNIKGNNKKQTGKIQPNTKESSSIRIQKTKRLPFVGNKYYYMAEASPFVV